MYALGSACGKVCPVKETKISSLMCLLSIVWRAVSNSHISPRRLCLQWHFPALSCHGANVGAVTTRSDSLFVQGHGQHAGQQGRSRLLPPPRAFAGPSCVPSQGQAGPGEVLPRAQWV